MRNEGVKTKDSYVSLPDRAERKVCTGLPGLPFSSCTGPPAIPTQHSKAVCTGPPVIPPFQKL